MENNPEKTALRKVLLKKRDSTSFDLQKIAAKQIQKNLKKIESFRKAESIAVYYPIGSEVRTQDIMQELLSKGIKVSLPKVIGDNLEFRRIVDFSSLERGMFDIMEPKEDCLKDRPELILMPAIGVAKNGTRLGYGHGYYDRFLESNKTESVALVLEKQIVKNIPKTQGDQTVDWIVTEDRVIKTQR